MKNTLEQIIAELPKNPVLDTSILKKDYTAIDLSIYNSDLDTVNVSSSELLGNHIDNYKKKNSSKVAYGGYLETRGIYQRSLYFTANSDASDRNIHLGMDLWLKEGSTIFTPLDAVVHSFNNNQNHGDYGPTILLKHQIGDFSFYTLYGHLSLGSIKNLSIGQAFQRGNQIAQLGGSEVNGDYPPHLHFQIIRDIGDYVGDYPGVCCKKDLEFYRKNCLDPNLILELEDV